MRLGPAGTRRTVIRLVDRLRSSLTLSDLYARYRRKLRVVQRRGTLTSLDSPDAAELFAVARRAHSPAIRAELRAALAPAISAALAAPRVHLPPAAPSRVEVSGVLVLKAAREDEPGVLFAGNETSWEALASLARASDLLERYELVGLSAWSPPDFRKFARFAGTSPRPFVVGISNVDDLEAYRLFEGVVEPLPLMASDWLNPNDFVPRARAARDVDIVMVAGWGRYKRHWLLFEALRDLPSTLRVVLIGANSQGRTVEDVKREAALFRVRQGLEFYTALPVRETNDWQARARVSVIFSGREGACLAITESMMADTPVGAMRDAHVGATRHINASTGMLFDRGRVGRQLGELLERSATYAPRDWLVAHASSAVSSARLDAFLSARAQREGRPWRSGVAPLFRRYFRPRYANPDDARRLAPEVKALEARYGLVLLAPSN